MISPRQGVPSRPFWFLPEFPPNPGGIGTYAATIGPVLATLGHEMHLLVGWDGPSRTEIDGMDVIHEPIRRAFEQGSPTEVIHFRRLIASLKSAIQPTVYDVHLSDSTPILHLATSAMAPAPMVLTLHNEMLKLFSATDPESLMARLLSEARVINGVSAAVARQAALAVPALAHRMVTIPYGVQFVEKAPPLPDRPCLLAIGRLIYQKGFDRLLHAMPTVLEQHPDAHLDVLGEGIERSNLEALIDELGLAGNVTLRGHVDRDLVPDFIASAQVVVVSSHFEGLPFAVLEAAMYGRPIVASRSGGVDEVVIDGQAGIILEQDTLDENPTALGSAINTLLDDNDLAHRYGATARTRVGRLFSADACADAYDHMYRAVTAPSVDVAVIIPAYNAARHLAAALDSALADADSIGVTVQILVIDDGSTDETSALARKYADRGVELFRQPNQKIAMARNAGIALTNSRFIAHLDADDTWPLGRLAALLAPFQLDPELDAVFGRAVEFADPDAPETALWNPEPMSVRMPTVGLLRRSVHDNGGAFDAAADNEQLSWSSQALALGLRYELIDDVVLERRIHAGNESHRRPFTSDRSRVELVKAALDARRRTHGAGTGSDHPPPG